MRAGSVASGIVPPHRWIVVVDAPFLPARGGGERENLGFVRAALSQGLVSALVVPTDVDPGKQGRSDDLAGLSELVDPAPAVFVPRDRSLRAALVPWRPYVVGSRPATAAALEQLDRVAPFTTGVVIYSYKSHHLGQVIARHFRLPAVVRMHNLEGRYHRALAASARGPRSWAMWVEAARVEVDERRLEKARWLNGIADISATDHSVRLSRTTRPTAHVPSFAFSITGPRRRRLPGSHVAEQPAVVFVGALDVATNYDAVAWFAEQVWPSIVRQVPEARWQVVGRNPTQRLRDALADVPNVELHANVAEPADYLLGATVAVNPAVSGSGVNIKLVEYLASGVPVVSTTIGLQGVGLTPGAHLESADDATTFARRVVELVRDPDRASALGRAGQEGAAAILDAHRSMALLKSLMAGAGATHLHPARA